MLSCCHDKNYYYFYKSNIPAINLIEDSIEILSDFQKTWVCKKLDNDWESFLPNTDNFLSFFIVFEWRRIFDSVIANLRPT